MTWIFEIVTISILLFIAWEIHSLKSKPYRSASLKEEDHSDVELLKWVDGAWVVRGRRPFGHPDIDLYLNASQPHLAIRVDGEIKTNG